MHRPLPSLSRRAGSGVVLHLLLVCSLVLVFVLGTPTDALAHGGQILPPPGPPPPPPPPPPEPPPPPPPPTDQPPTKPPPPSTPGGTPPPVLPGVPPTTPPTTPTTPPPLVAPPTSTPNPTGGRPTIPRPEGRGPLRGSRTGTGTNPGEAWQTWWALNRLGLLPDRTEALRHAPITPNDDDPDGTNRRSGWARRRSLVGGRHVLPLLLRLVDPKTRARDDVVASALIALGKVSNDPAVTEIIARHLTDRRAAPLVRESAALALGLFARSEPALQRSAEELDAIRDRLIAAYDDVYLHDRARAFAALSLGLLGDQPCSLPYAKDGRLVIRALWTRLEAAESRRGLTVALLTALGMQPSAGTPDAVREGLRRIVSGRRTLGRTWDPIERSHALTASLRLGGPATHATLVRVLARKRECVEVRRAAYVALGPLAGDMTAPEREEVARHLRDSLRKGRDPLTTGLGRIAQGHLLGADLRSTSERVFRTTPTAHELIAEARNGSTPTRGFSALALALAMRDVETTSPEVGEFLAEGGRALLRGLVGGRGDDRMRAAYAVAVGIAGSQEALEPLLEAVADGHADPELRGHAAVSVGQLGRRTPDAQRVLFGALSQRRDAELRRQAALGLALLGGRVVGTQLLKELETGRTEQLLAQVVIALGRLGDLQAVPPLTTYAADDGRAEFAQALSVVALGMIADPEPRPTLLRLTQHANYPALTDSLHEAFTIL